ncbi:MAG: hypothetical protein ABII71_06335 [Candidatus Micrarchaeota archaeon]
MVGKREPNGVCLRLRTFNIVKPMPPEPPKTRKQRFLEWAGWARKEMKPGQTLASACLKTGGEIIHSPLTRLSRICTSDTFLDKDLVGRLAATLDLESQENIRLWDGLPDSMDSGCAHPMKLRVVHAATNYHDTEFSYTVSVTIDPELVDSETMSHVAAVVQHAAEFIHKEKKKQD